MDQSISERLQTDAEKLLAHHPSTKGLAIAMSLTPHSNQVAAYGYHAEQKTLRVRFKFGNSEYDYHRCEPDVVEGLADAKSKGGFLKDYVKGVFHVEKTREKDPLA